MIQVQLKSFLPISIIIPTHDRYKKLEVLLESIAIQINSSIEVIVIDNSTDEKTSEFIKKYCQKQKYKLIYIREINNRKSYFARNIGLKKASGEIITFIDDDCILNNNWIKQVGQFFIRFRGCAAVGKSVNANVNNIYSITDDFKTRRLINYNISKKGKYYYTEYVDTKNFVISNKLLIKHNLSFDDEFTSGGDIDFGLQLNKAGIPLLYNPKMIVHHEGVDNLLKLMQKEFNKGNGKFLLEQKWNLKQKNSIIFFIYDLITDINKDNIIKNLSSIEKIIVFLLIIFCTIIYHFGKKYQKIRYLIKKYR